MIVADIFMNESEVGFEGGFYFFVGAGGVEGAQLV